MDCRTGNSISDRVNEISFTGNIVPPVWFKTITNDKGKPFLLAIMILSEIVYWYRPVEERDERTGEFTGYRTKFKQDLLQKSYKELAEYYQVSKRQVTDAVIALEKIGVINRVFRTITHNGSLCNNVLFIKLNPDKLYELTYPHDESDSKSEKNVDKNVDNTEKTTTLSRKNGTGCPEKKGEPIPKKRDTNTEITKEITNIDYNSISSNQAKGIYAKEFAKQISYDEIRIDYKNDRFACGILDQCVDIAASVMVSKQKRIVISGDERPTDAVKTLLRQLNIFHMEYVIDSFLDTKTKVKKIQNYLLACMVNSVYSLDVKIANDVARFEGT